MRERARVGIGVMAAVALLAAQGAPGAERDSASHVDPTQLLAQIESGTAPAIVDVRTAGEFEAGHVPGALHIPFWAIPGRTEEIPAAPDDPIVVYCAHGPRAGIARAVLRMAGFRRVLYLKGHMSGWREAGLPEEGAAPDPE